jgi:hypothetical protein
MTAHIPIAPVILSDKRERFIRGIIQGLSQRAAYQAVYPNASPAAADAAASRLLRMNKVQARLEQIRQAEAAAAKIDLPYLTGLLTASYRLGLQTNQSSAATQAAMGLAKLHGFLIERHQIDAVVRRPASSPESPDEMSESKWLEDYGPILDLTLNDTASPEPQVLDTMEDLFGPEPQVQSK